METTIQVKSASLSSNKEWYNLTTADNKRLWVEATKNPKLKEVIETAQAVPYLLNGNVTVKDGKVFLWDGTEKPVIRPNPPDGPCRAGLTKTDLLIVAQCCLKSVCELHAGRVTTFDTIKADADKAFEWVISKTK